MCLPLRSPFRFEPAPVGLEQARVFAGRNQRSEGRFAEVVNKNIFGADNFVARLPDS